jgi:phosphoribosylformylglycinamidine cyclo-ligase
VFDFLQQAGGIDQMEMLRTFNNGIGFVLCVAERDADAVTRTLREAGEAPLRIGRMVAANAQPTRGSLLACAQGARLG